MPTALYDLFIVLQGDRTLSQIICHLLVGYKIITILITDGQDIPILLQQVHQGPIEWDGPHLGMEVMQVNIGEHN